MTTFDAPRFAAAVRAKRGTRSLRDVAPECGVTPSTLSRIEHGNLPDTRSFAKLTAWLGIPATEWFAEPIGTVEALRVVEILLTQTLADPDLVSALMTVIRLCGVKR